MATSSSSRSNTRGRVARSAVTICQVDEAAAGPFVLRGPLDRALAAAAEHGFAAVELFFPGPDFVDLDVLRGWLGDHDLAVAAVGTGAGMLRHGLSLTDADPARRAAAQAFLLEMVDFGGQLGAPAILGSMQGRWGAGVARDAALGWLAEALALAGAAAARHAVPFLYEPLNRYETNLFNRLEPAAGFLAAHGLANLRLLADLFHMNLEERDMAEAIRAAGSWIGHIHWADSNRQAIGLGHTDVRPLIAALGETGYTGYFSAEVLPLPDPTAAARQTIESLRPFLT